MLPWKLRERHLYQLSNRCAVQFLQISSLQYRRRVILCQEKRIQAAQEIRKRSFWILCCEIKIPAN